MKTAKMLNATLILGVIAIMIATVGFTSLVSAQDTEAAPEAQTIQAETTEEPATDTEEQPAEEVTAETYTYVAQPGDSYTKMARKAVQTYGIQTGTNLSGAQIVYAETNLTKLAGSPVLSVGQEVVIEQSVVSEWVEKAGQLTEAQAASWQAYADTVDFNTNAVGEVQS